MRHSRRRGQRIAVVATVLGTILLLVGAYMMFVENDEDEPTAAGPTAPQVSLQPTQPPRNELPEGFEKFFDDAGGAVTVTGDPLKNAGTGTTVHHVVITLTSDGPMKYVYRTQHGDTPVREANRRTSMTYDLRGPRAVAQAYVQVGNGSTYATCTITVDGVIASTSTARQPYQVVVCTG